MRRVEAQPHRLVAVRGRREGARSRQRAAVEYWTAFPDEIDDWVDRAEADASEAEQRWRREQVLLGR